MNKVFKLKKENTARRIAKVRKSFATNNSIDKSKVKKVTLRKSGDFVVIDFNAGLEIF